MIYTCACTPMIVIIYRYYSTPVPCIQCRMIKSMHCIHHHNYGRRMYRQHLIMKMYINCFVTIIQSLLSSLQSFQSSFFCEGYGSLLGSYIHPAWYEGYDCVLGCYSLPTCEGYAFLLGSYRKSTFCGGMIFYWVVTSILLVVGGMILYCVITSYSHPACCEGYDCVLGCYSLPNVDWGIGIAA